VQAVAEDLRDAVHGPWIDDEERAPGRVEREAPRVRAVAEGERLQVVRPLDDRKIVVLGSAAARRADR
jgi:hypothetical protein